MHEVSCKLISITSESNSIGVNKTKKTVKKEIPIIKVENVFANEFYIANEKGHKPSLRLRISALNYSDEEELEYMNKKYSIIRTQEVTADEIILVCERKIKNV